MNVLHVVSNLDPESGGPVEALRGLANAQVKAGLSVGVLATWKQGADLRFAEELKTSGVHIRLVGPCYGPLCWRWDLARNAYRAVSEFDIIHIHALWEDIQHQAAKSANALDKPYLIRPCGMLDPWSLSQGGWKKSLYLRWRLRRHIDRASSLHFTTDIERDLTKPLALKSPGIVEPNGIQVHEFRELPERGNIRRKYGIPDEVPVCLFLSRLHPKKGLDLLFPAFAALDQPAHLVVAGPASDDYRATLEAEVSRLNLGNRVHFAGMLRGQEKLAAFVDADLFVLPSRQENFGNAVVEALAAGVPVVISDQVNIWPEVRGADVGGVVALEVKAITEELRRWLSDADLRKQTAHRAKAFANERYDWDAIAQRWIKHYAALLSKPERKPVKSNS